MLVLVTGAAGFVARHLAAELAAAGHGVVSTDVVPQAPWMPGYEPCDLCDAAALDSLVWRLRPDACIHLGGVSSVPDAARDCGRLFAINVGGTRNLLESFMRHVPNARFLYVSTAQVYGCSLEPDSLPLTEDATPYPVSLYAISRVAAEATVRAYWKFRGLRATIARPANHTGPGQSPKFVAPSFIAQAKEIAAGTRGEFTVGNLDSVRDFSDVRDVVAAYRAILEKGAPGETYNASSAPRITIGALLGKVKALAGVEAPAKVDPALYRPTDFSLVLDTGKLRALGWKPERTLDETLRDMFHHENQSPKPN